MRTLTSSTGVCANQRDRNCSAALPVLLTPPLTRPECGGVTARAAEHSHTHRCAACGELYPCAGAGDTGVCTPVCAPCYWVELGGQLTAYRAIVSALERKRQQLEQTVGPAACLRALELRRRGARLGLARRKRRQKSVDEANQAQK